MLYSIINEIYFVKRLLKKNQIFFKIFKKFIDWLKITRILIDFNRFYNDKRLIQCIFRYNINSCE